LVERGLGLVGAPNVRDLGGIVTADGRRVREGLLFRASALGRLTDADLAALTERKLACVLDLRDATEIEAAPPDRLPTDPAPWYGTFRSSTRSIRSSCTCPRY
jgi:protein-tyrosine phosphatase